MLFNTVYVGQLGIMTSQGYPRVIPLNFAAMDGNIYFHGAPEGEKFTAFLKRPKVTFSIYKEYAYIPSHWQGEHYACPATQFYKSALIKGEGLLVEDLNEKAVALTALMKKHQPEGIYDPITPEDKMYQKALKEVTIFCVRAEQTDVKGNFGQALTKRVRKLIAEKLRERGGDLDIQAAEEIESSL